MKTRTPTITYQPTDVNPVEKTLATIPESPEDEDEPAESESIALLNEGAYGCIFYPGIRCDGKLESREYITKIQKKTHVTDTEYEVSERIQKHIPNHQDYFAPITKQCPVKITKKYLNDVKKCNVFQEDIEETKRNAEDHNAVQYVSNKIRYLGTETIKSRLFDIASGKIDPSDVPPKTRPMSITFWNALLKTHIRILTAVELLWSAHIIHMDLKYGNVMFDPAHHMPIIIDFGISVRRDLLLRHIGDPKSETHRRAFYVYDTYPAWCFDIFLCGYIVHQVGLEDANSKYPTNVEMTKIMREFQYGNAETYPDKNKTRNGIFTTHLVSQTAIESFRKNIVEEYAPNADADGAKPRAKSWKQIYDDHIRNTSNTWDNYSVAVMYLDMLDLLQSELVEAYSQIESVMISGKTSLRLLKAYIDVIESIVYVVPAKRPSVKDTITKLEKLLDNLKEIPISE
jgi:serine/threonine protein kinase